MQIHELNSFAGTPGAGNYLAIDNGSDTGKISGQNLLKPVNDRISNLAASVTPDSIVTLIEQDYLWNDTFILAQSVANFDYLDIYFKDGGNTPRYCYSVRVPVSAFPAIITVPETSNKFLYFSKFTFSVSGKNLTVSEGILWEWDGVAADAATSQSGVVTSWPCRVDGVKTSSNTPAELADIRFGANGKTYASAGDAVRGQITALKEDLSTMMLVKNAYQGGTTYAGQGSAFVGQVLTNDSNRIRSFNSNSSVNNGIFIPAGAELTITVDIGYKYAYQVFSMTTGLGLDAFAFDTDPVTVQKTEDTSLIIVLAKTDNSDILPSEMSHVSVMYRDEVKDAIIDLQNNKENRITFEHSFIQSVYQGGFANASQNYSLNSLDVNTLSTRIRTFETKNDLQLIKAGESVSISVNAGYKYAYQVYSATTLLGKDVFAFSESDHVIRAVEDLYFGLMLGKTDDSDISISEISNVSIIKTNNLEDELSFKLDVHNIQTLTPEEQEIGRTNLGIDNSDTTVAIPFAFLDGIKIYKSNGKYSTNFIPQSKAITGVNKVVVYMSPDGNDSNNGLTVLTPKKTLGSALAVSNVGTIILLEGTYISGTHYSSFQQVTTEINLIGVGTVVFDNGNNDPIYFYRDVYCENIHFKGGKIALVVKYSTADRAATFYRCKFSDSKQTNGLSVLGGIAYLVECIAYNNAFDGFNYHANTDVTPNIPNYALEVDCISYGNGTVRLDQSDGQSSNGSTTHDNSYIVRVNGEYYACHGGIIADKDSHSANYGCRAGVSTVTDEANYPDRLSNYWSSGAVVYLYDCISYGSKYDTAKILGGTIISNVVYPSNYPA